MSRLLFIGAILIFSQTLTGQTVKTIDKPELGELLAEKEPGITYVYNFWATWCAPCVKEIPYFEELHKASDSNAVQVILINLDFPNQLEKRVIPFLDEKNITATVYQMVNMDYNSWISMVHDEWSGAIPATLIMRGEETLFYEGELQRDELFELIEL